MNLKEKYTAKFLVLIAGIIIFAHTVFPHHHHFDTIESHPDNLECGTTKTDKQSDNPETHCHALNIVVLEKTSNNVVKPSLVSHIQFNLFNIETKLDLVFFTNDFINISCFNFSLQKQLFLTTHSLRGPPASA